MEDQSTARAAIGRIRNAKFRTIRWGGYNDREVDDFLDEMIVRLERGESVGPGMAPAFNRARMRPGYRKADVDALLGELGVSS